MIASGTKLGPYEIVAPIGAGGMGEVYRARDTRLSREVAIKVLPAEFTRDAERLRRFEQEARAASALNHPNILTIFDIGSHEGVPYVVYELLEGATLRETGAVSQRRAMEFAQQIAQGLAAAHDKGITHRDLKPENLFVTTDDRVKILDFGLPKVSGPAEVHVDATQSGQTQPGAVLGTVGYMSPEQVRGEAADHRADIFSFGAILYEMISQRRAFRADSSVSTMHAILTEDPPLLEHAALERIVRHCLEKSPARRFQSARDIGFALEAISGTSASKVAALPQPRRKLWAAVAVAAAIVAAAALGYMLHAPRAETNWTATLLPGPATSFEPRVSPDGRTVAFEAMVDNLTQVAVINPESGDWSVLTKDRSRGYVEHLSWSKDGSTIYYHRILDVPRGIYSVPMLGGEERLVLEEAGRPEVLPDGSLLVTKINAQRQPQIYRFWPQNGRLEALPALLFDDEFTSIRVFSDGLEAAFLGRSLGQNEDHLVVMDLASHRLRRIDGDLAVDPRGISVDSARSKVLAVVKAGDLQQVVALPRSGSAAAQIVLSLHTVPWYVDVGPDGSVYLDQVGRTTEVLRYPASGGVPEHLPGSGLNHFQVVNHFLPLPGGKSLLEAPFAGRYRLMVAAAGKDPQTLVQTNEETAMPGALLPGGQLAFVLGSGAQRTIAIASMADGRIVRRLTSTQGNGLSYYGNSLAASPDGRTLYYSSANTIWSVPSTGGQPSKILSGDSVTGHPNGRELFIQINEAEGARIVRLPVSGGEAKPIPLQLPSGMRIVTVPLTANAVSPNGQLVVGVATPDIWFYQAAIVDVETGKVQKIPLRLDGDVLSPGWTADGRVASLGKPINSSIWRYRPAP